MINERYTYYFINSLLELVQRNQYNNGLAQPNLSSESVKLFLIPLPPLQEQKRIVAKIDEIMGYLDKLQDLIDGKSLEIEGVQAKEIALSKEEQLV